MLDVGWTELLVIAVVLIVVVGPKDLPPMLRAFGKMTTRLRAMAGEFRSQFDEALKEAELDDVRKTIGDAQKLNPMNSIRDAINPLRQTANEIKADLQRAATVETPAVSETKATATATAAAEAASGTVTLPDIDTALAQPPVVSPASTVDTAAASASAAAAADNGPATAISIDVASTDKPAAAGTSPVSEPAVAADKKDGAA
ncbi:twin-arginine translocase subunit TatB [Metarhizobium album]|uniref:Sec-independent protein translocase protein TatB n=1 Tax=Metarhizobium album TaxID=2182425 RepID=A0A2U2DQ55_9HYPH|nr:Sec-independent protein translocase protein TatB [Rhizobium album]PWE55412.1 twin-arginine translocase subunit TatB [Rhizobium album]